MRLIDADALKEKAFGKRGGLIHTEDIDAAPTITQANAQDLIDRQELIDRVDYLINRVSDCKVGTETFKDGLIDGYCRIRSIVKELPSAQLETSILTVTVAPDSEEIERVVRKIYIERREP